MKQLKTYAEFEENLDEATITQWAKRGALTGAALGAGVAVIGGALGVAGLGAALAVPLAAWGAVTLGVHGLVGGVLLAGGQARKDFKTLEKRMKMIEKFKGKETLTPADEKRLQKAIVEAKFYVRKLKTSMQNIDINTSQGLLRKDIRNVDKVIVALETMEIELAKLG